MEAPVLECLFNKVEGLMAPTQAFSCEYCEIFKNTYVEEHLLTGASVFFLRGNSTFYKNSLKTILVDRILCNETSQLCFNIYHKQHIPQATSYTTYLKTVHICFRVYFFDKIHFTEYRNNLIYD